MIGDRMDTDIISGMEAGLHTVLVLTGVTGRGDTERYPFRPSRIVDSIADLVPDARGRSFLDDCAASAAPAAAGC